MILWFSGTGNSKWCADVLARELEDESINTFTFIRDKKAGAFTSDRPWVFVVPTYAWRVPRVFKDFLLRSTFEGARDVYFVMTCGGDIANAQKTNKKLAERLGLAYKGTLEVVMPENYIAMFDVPAADVIERQFKEGYQLLLKTADQIRQGETLGVRPVVFADRLKSSIVNACYYPTCVHAKKFYATDACTSCGLCERLCPLGAITLQDGHPVWQDSCTHCMACIAHCPVSCIEYGDVSEGKIRYRAENFIPNDLR